MAKQNQNRRKRSRDEDDGIEEGAAVEEQQQPQQQAEEENGSDDDGSSDNDASEDNYQSGDEDDQLDDGEEEAGADDADIGIMGDEFELDDGAGDDDDDEDDEEGDDADGSSGDEEGSPGTSGAEDGDEGDDEEDDEDEDERGKAKFTEGGKAHSFAKAFAKIMERKVKAKQAAAAGDAPLEHAAILAESSTLAKRQEAEAADAAAAREAKRLRLEMKQRGHLTVPRKGEDPTHDLREKQLQRLATKGVVLLFNAVAKAQKAASDAAGGIKAAPKLSKAAFLAQLKGGAAAADGGAAAPAAGGVLGLGAAAGGKSKQAAAEEPSWKVLQAGFNGLTGRSKMKDWDKAEDSGSEGDMVQHRGVDANSESDGGDDGW